MRHVVCMKEVEELPIETLEKPLREWTVPPISRKSYLGEKEAATTTTDTEGMDSDILRPGACGPGVLVWTPTWNACGPGLLW